MEINNKMYQHFNFQDLHINYKNVMLLNSKTIMQVCAMPTHVTSYHVLIKRIVLDSLGVTLDVWEKSSIIN